MRLIKTNPNNSVFFEESEIKVGNTSPNSEGSFINVYDEVCYQEVLGFGGAFTESSAYNYSLMDDATKKQFIKSYFDKQEGIGYNLGRTHINSCDFSLDIYTYVQDGDNDLSTFNIERDKKYIIPFLKDALAYCDEDVFLFASPWSPPAYMKENESPISGGALKDEYKKLWAKYYAKYIKAYAKEGIKISAITIQNEPKADQTWESCCYSDEQEKEFLEKYLIPTLDEEGLSDIKIMIWDHNKERVYDRAKAILVNQETRDRVFAIAHHWYSGDHFETLRLVHEQFGKPSMCTEFCGDIEEDSHSLAERYAKEMCGNFNNYEIGSCDWNLLLSTDGGPYHNRTAGSESRPGLIFESKDKGCHAPILYNQKEGKLVITPIYYYIGHISKYAKRGARVIATTKYTDKLSVVGFKNHDDSIAIAVYNLSDYALPVVIRRHGVCSQFELEAHSAATVID